MSWRKPQRSSHMHLFKNNNCITKMFCLYQGSRQKCALNWYDKLFGLAEIRLAPTLFDQFKRLWWKCKAVNKVSLPHRISRGKKKAWKDLRSTLVYSWEAFCLIMLSSHRVCERVCVWERNISEWTTYLESQVCEMFSPLVAKHICNLLLRMNFSLSF